MRKGAETPAKDRYVYPGSFGNYMNIETVCDGPLTLVIDSVKDPRAVQKYEQMQKRLARGELKNQKAQEKKTRPPQQVEESKDD